MIEYIKREDAVRWEPDPKSEREYQTGNLDDAYESGYDNKVRQIENLPAADVRENVHGKWLHTAAAPHRVYCSVCCETYLRNEQCAEELPIILHPNYCPSCGAQMEEGQR